MSEYSGDDEKMRFMSAVILSSLLRSGYTNTGFLLYYFENLALPSVLIVSPAVYPCLVVYYNFSYFSLKKWTQKFPNQN